MTSGHTTGTADGDGALVPPPGTTVVVHWSAPSGGAPIPHDRAVLRFTLDRARSATVWLVALEPVLGSTTTPELDGAGVVTVATGLQTRRWLTANRDRIESIVYTDIAIAALVDGGQPTPPRVLLERVGGQRLAPPTIEREEDEGQQWFLDARRARDAALRATIDEVVALDGSPTAVAATRGDGDTIVFVGCVVTDRSGDTESDMRWFADAVMPELRRHHPSLRLLVAAFDGAITRRAIECGTPCSADDAWAAIDRAAVVVVGGPPSNSAEFLRELTGAGVVPVVVDAEAGVPRAVEQCNDMLARPRRAPVARTPWEPPSRQGTLAAHTTRRDCFAREVYGTQQLPWLQALIANSSMPVPDRYRLWHSVHHGPDARPVTTTARPSRLTYRPRISVVVPVHDTDAAVLRATIESVRAQTYPRWELCLVDDASTRPTTTSVLAELAATDERIRVHRLEPSQGIAGATNAGIAMAGGAYVAFVDHDDVLAPSALYWIVRRLELDGDLDVLYTDEDKLDEDGARVEPFFKPDWSPDYLLSLNYVTHLLVVRRRLLEEVGGLRHGFDGAQDYDLLLRLAEATDRIAHIPAPLYSWRKVRGSTAADINAKPAAHAASERAVDEALERRAIGATRDVGLQPTWHRVRYHIANRPLVSIIIPTRDRVDLLAPCIDRVRSTTTGQPTEFVIVDNDSQDQATLDYLAEAASRHDVRVVRYPHRFNFARQMNLAALAATGEMLLLLNNDVRPIATQWLDALLEHAQRPEVGAVGARLVWPDGRAQHEGIVLNAGGVALNLNSGPYAAYGRCIRNTSAVTAACLMTRASVFAAVGGMDERLRVAYNDVDLCLRIGERGWRVIYTPYAELEHAESSTRGSLHPTIDEAFFQKRWGPPHTALDPFYTPNLELMQPWSPRL